MDMVQGRAQEGTREAPMGVLERAPMAVLEEVLEVEPMKAPEEALGVALEEVLRIPQGQTRGLTALFRLRTATWMCLGS
jgi:hypothetical protein